MNEASDTDRMGLSDWDFSPTRSTDLKPTSVEIAFAQASSPSKLQDPSIIGNEGCTKFQDPLNFLIHLYHAFGGNVASDELRKLVDIFSSKIVKIYKSDAKKTKEPLLNVDEFSCPICFGVVSEPHTISCGHSYCKKCLQKEHVESQCRLCGQKLTILDVSETKPNVLLASLVEKLWPNNNKTAALRTEGNELFQKKKREEAVEKYEEAILLSPTDHLSLCNRSHALLTLGRSEEALMDAEAAIKYCPLWLKGYFRKAVTLTSLGRFEEAFTTLTLCIYLIKLTKTEDEAAMNPVKNEMVKVLHKLFESSPNYGKPSLRRHTLDHSLFSPYPNQKKCKRFDRSWGCSTWRESECYSSGDEGNPGLNDTSVTRNTRKPGCLIDSSHLNHHKGSATFGGVKDQTVVRIQRLFSRGTQELATFKNHLKSTPTNARNIDETLILGSDFECSLCYRLLYQPATTSCGHTYCRCCLERCRDHSPTCPLCKTALKNPVPYQRHAITHTLDTVISKHLSKEYADRVNQHLEELADVTLTGKNQEIEIPIFVCTMAFPTVPCPLHVYEPRYRLMIRRCMESGSRRFGMCCYLQEGDHNYGDFGTLLEIRSVQYYPDGRSVLDTVGVRRFKVLKKSIKDGYNIASIEYVEDQPIEDADRTKVQESHEKVFKEATEWLQSINQVLRQRIYRHFGQMPVPEDDWIKVAEGPSWTWWLLAILPLDAKAQFAILSMNSLQKRLESIHKVLRYVKSRLT